MNRVRTLGACAITFATRCRWMVDKFTATSSWSEQKQLKWSTLLRLVGSLRKPWWQRQREVCLTEHLMSRGTGSRSRSVENSECGSHVVWWKTLGLREKFGLPLFLPNYEFSLLKWEFESLLVKTALKINSACCENSLLDQKPNLTFREKENHFKVGPRRGTSPYKMRVAPSGRLLLLRVWKYGQGLVIMPVMWHILKLFFLILDCLSLLPDKESHN